MARKKEVEINEKPLKKIKYFARYVKYGFQVNKVDEEGNIIYQKNLQGQDKYGLDGNKIPITINILFNNIETSMIKGYKCDFEFDPNDKSAQNIEIGKRLVELDNDEGIGVENEDKFEKRENPKAFAEKKKAEDFNSKIHELESRLNDPEELQRRLEELTRP